MNKLSIEEAIKILKDMKVDIPVPKAAVTQIKRNIALDMAVDALSKQIPKKPKYTILKYLCEGNELKVQNPECPSCRNNGKTLWDAAIPRDQDYCHRCGQAIDWSEYY